MVSRVIRALVCPAPVHARVTALSSHGCIPWHNHLSSIPRLLLCSCQTVFDKEQVVVILQNVVEEILKDQPYDHSRIGQWINDICERCTKELVGLGKPFKYVMTAVIMQRNGAGLHTVSSCFWDNANDGSASYKYDNKAMYCVATCYALAI